MNNQGFEKIRRPSRGYNPQNPAKREKAKPWQRDNRKRSDYT